MAALASTSETEPQAAAQPPYPPARTGWAMVAIIFVTSIVSTLDRGVLTLVVDPIRHDLAISDLQIGVLQGLSFGIFYALVGVPLGVTADRLSRRNLLALGVAGWSLATIGGGFAQNFGQLFLSRLLVGLGEATLAPCAVSMIGDLFPPQRRGKPVGVYVMGQALSGGVSIALTGMILAAAPHGLFRFAPGLSELAPWRTVFVVCGAAGLIVAALLLLFREPARRGVRTSQGLGAAAFAGYLGRHWRVFAPFYLGFAVLALAVYGAAAWNAAFLIRAYRLPAPVVGQWLGLTATIAGVSGALASGPLVDRLARRRIADGKFRILAAASWLGLPSALAALSPSPVLATVLLGFSVASFPLVGATMIAAVQELTPNQMRGVAVALFGLANTLVGAVAGPLLIALATEHLFHDPAKIGFSMMLVMIPAQACACLLFLLGRAALRRSIARGGELAGVMGYAPQA